MNHAKRLGLCPNLTLDLTSREGRFIIRYIYSARATTRYTKVLVAPPKRTNSSSVLITSLQAQPIQKYSSGGTISANLE